MSDVDQEGCVYSIGVAILVAAFICWVTWEYNHPSPKELADRQAVEMRKKEDADLAEWQRAKALKEMQVDKAKAEDATLQTKGPKE